MTRQPLIKRILLGLAIIMGLVLAAFVFVFFAVKYGWTNTAGIVDTDFSPAAVALIKPVWSQTEEWQTLAAALVKDQAVINRVASETGLTARLIVSLIVPEQLRLFYSEREVFKQIFSPLKILGNQTQFSLGVAGLKQETAKEIEVRDKTGLLAFTSTSSSPDQERFARLTDEHNHYYSYLYTALFTQEIMAEWREAGFPIAGRPEILATLFNIGFEHSEPKAAPQVGGAAIEIEGKIYSFGALAYEFYQSGELLDEFPR